jgi:2,4-dienoyl-CoA reductase-like NADH-dependent reductase (Old Yellow Enzyme family)
MRRTLAEAHLGSLVLRNRLIRSATWEGMADENGLITPRLVDYLVTLARGGVGLIVSGYTFVHPAGKQLPGQAGICSDAALPGLTQLATAVHAAGGKLCIQLVHAGGQTTSKAIGQQPVAPSAIQVPQYAEMPAPLTEAEIGEIVQRFASAARICQQAGCDAVQLHGGHGYLISQFLSPLTNRRTDGYGGDLNGRSRFLREVYRAIRTATGGSFPILIKLNGADNLGGGFEIDEAVEVARMLDDEGIDAIEITGGTPASGEQTPVRTGISSREQEGYNLQLAVRIKNSVSCPVGVVGGFRSFELIDGIIRREEVDFVAMSRPFIREPALVQRWADGQETHARCISCNGCFKPGLKEGGIYCVVEKIEEESRQLSL